MNHDEMFSIIKSGVESSSVYRADWLKGYLMFLVFPDKLAKRLHVPECVRLRICKEIENIYLDAVDDA